MPGVPGITLKKKESAKESTVEQTALSQAREAVKTYEEQRQVYEELKQQFEQDYPEAADELRSLDKIKDTVSSYIAEAKRLVALAKETVGEFKCQRKFAQAHYDAQLVVEICLNEGRRDLLFDLFRSGIFKNFTFERDAANIFFDRMSAEEKANFSTAWKEEEEMTPAIYTPKL